nr:MAG TPA: DNA polymerase [Caudoviricetes sp.]
MQGWVKIHRDLLDNELWSDKPFTKGQAWVDLLLLANHRDKNALLGNCTELVERGSLITSELKLMERWGWGRKKVKLFLNFLESQKMIERNANNKRTAITIVNYGFYQDCDLPKEQQKNSKRTAKEQQRDSTGTAKEHKQERKNERMKEYIDTNVSIKQHSIQSIIDAWNQLEPYGIKMIYRINPGSKRCTSLIALLEQFGEEKVIQAVDKVKQSDFLQGKTDTRFSLNFDWFINPNNFVKVLDGKYDERHDKKPATKNNNNFERRHYDMDDLESKLLGR